MRGIAGILERSCIPPGTKLHSCLWRVPCFHSWTQSQVSRISFHDHAA